MRRPDIRIAITAEGPRAMVVRENKYHVCLLCSLGSSQSQEGAENADDLEHYRGALSHFHSVGLAAQPCNLEESPYLSGR